MSDLRSHRSPSWREVLEADLKSHPAPSNVTGILSMRMHGGYQLTKQTSWGEDYIAFGYTVTEAWNRLSAITGQSVGDLKRLPITQVQ